MPAGPICIITASGMICEAASYHRPSYDDKGNAKGRKVSDEAWQGKTTAERIAKLIELADVQGGPFMIIPRPTDP